MALVAEHRGNELRCAIDRINTHRRLIQQPAQFASGIGERRDDAIGVDIVDLRLGVSDRIGGQAHILLRIEHGLHIDATVDGLEALETDGAGHLGQREDRPLRDIVCRLGEFTHDLEVLAENGNEFDDAPHRVACQRSRIIGVNGQGLSGCEGALPIGLHDLRANLRGQRHCGFELALRQICADSDPRQHADHDENGDGDGSENPAPLHVRSPASTTTTATSAAGR